MYAVECVETSSVQEKLAFQLWMGGTNQSIFMLLFLFSLGFLRRLFRFLALLDFGFYSKYLLDLIFVVLVTCMQQTKRLCCFVRSNQRSRFTAFYLSFTHLFWSCCIFLTWHKYMSPTRLYLYGMAFQNWKYGP